MMNRYILRQAAALAVTLACSLTWAGSPAWLGPPAPGSAYPAGEEDRQYAMLAYDLAHRDAFQRIAKETFRPQALVFNSDRDPLDVILRRSEALLTDIRRMPGAGDLQAAAGELAGLRAEADKTAPGDRAARRTLFNQVCRARRRIALANPLLDFKDILFVKRQRCTINHMCDQFYGMVQRPGGGVFILADALGPKPIVRDLLAHAVVETGRLRGRELTGGPRRTWNLNPDINALDLHGEPTEGGSFVSPDLSYDGQTVLFAYTECAGGAKHLPYADPPQGHWDAGRCFHIFAVGRDGNDLRQLTDGTWNDFQPCWMPSGRIAFVSERRGGYLRCGRSCPTFTLHDMAADGSDVRCLSHHETNEWHPGVTRDGMIIYTRWDYIDRNAMVVHLPWVMTPDGRDPRALHGNFSFRYARPDMELDVRAIPNSPRFVATAAPHHGQAFGSLVLLDPRVRDDDRMAPVKRLTPDVGFPETQGGSESYGDAWPLSEDYYLCSYDPVQVPGLNPAGMGSWGDPGAGYPAQPFHRAPNPQGYYGLYLIDSFGNKELIYRDAQIGCRHPIPLAPRRVPPVVPEASRRVPAESPAEATVGVVNVFRGSKPWPARTKIASLRVYQVLPQTLPSILTADTGVPVDATSVNVARAVLGTVPVEADGSAYFTVPARREVFFQALDEQGLAVTSMRSATEFQPGELGICEGCHAPRHQSPVTASVPWAMRRPPSRLQPDVDGTHPFSYPRLVQPVLDKHCVACHREKADKTFSLDRSPVVFRGPWRPATFYASYLNLVPKYGFYTYGAHGYGDPKFYRTTPGEFGARASKLYRLLLAGHYGVKLDPAEMHRLSVWLDSCSLFYGVYEKEGQAAQLRGEIVQPTLQ